MIIMRSDAVKKGMQTAPQRSLFNALGITEKELEKIYNYRNEFYKKLMQMLDSY